MEKINTRYYIEHCKERYPEEKVHMLFKRIVGEMDDNEFYNTEERSVAITEVQERLYWRAVAEGWEDIGELPEGITHQHRLDIIFNCYPPRQGFKASDVV